MKHTHQLTIWIPCVLWFLPATFPPIVGAIDQDAIALRLALWRGRTGRYNLSMAKGAGASGKLTKPAGVSLERALSKFGYCSRARARQLILAGRVEVDGIAQRNPAVRVDMRLLGISVDGRPVNAASQVYLMLNKPRGLVTTLEDERGRPTVYQCLSDPALPWVFPVGRLDKASEGLLLFTNDTRWAARILDPAAHLDKVYHVQIDCLPDEQLLGRMLAGVQERGELLTAKSVRVLRRGMRHAWLEVVLDEGKNRHIRRLLAGLGVKVGRLVRVAIGTLELGDLPKGAYRPLSAGERDALR